LVCDETGSLSSQLAGYSEDIEFIETNNLAQAVQTLEQCPAHAMILNAASRETLWSQIEIAQSEIQDTPIVGCVIPRSIASTMEAGAQGYVIKPVTPHDLVDAIGIVGKPVRHVLVVDDDPDVRRLFTRMLRVCDSTLSISTAVNGEDALNAAFANPPGLILLDVVMPGMDGWQVLEHLRQDRRTAEIPVVLVSAQDLVDKPPESKLLVSTMGDGLSPAKLLHCSLALSSLLLKPEETPLPTPV
jgi:CheY-like chemotaxis protein